MTFALNIIIIKISYKKGVIKIKSFKCKYCETKDTEDKLVLEVKEYTRKSDHKDGKWKKGDKYNLNIRYHRECFDKSKQEQIELDDLYETIKRVCQVDTITPSYMGLIQRLRNGDPVIGMKKDDVRHFKQGFPYPVIQRTFEEKAGLIQWKESQWDGSSGRFLTYVLVYYIMENIEDVNKQMTRDQQQEERLESMQPTPIEDFEIKSKNKEEDNFDISAFL